MGIKEKDLEGLILQLFDTSLEIQNKIRNICGISHRETEISNESACVRNTVDKPVTVCQALFEKNKGKFS